MDRNTLLLIAGRIVVFLVAVFLVLTLTYLTFFVISDEARLLPRSATIPVQPIYDDLMIGEPRIDQYINFMAKMISGEFFLSSGVRSLSPTSDFAYDHIYATAGRLIVITAVVMTAGFGYAFLAARYQDRLTGRTLRAVALASAAVAPPLWYFGFILVFREWTNDFPTIVELSLYLSCFISLTAASAMVFERTARITRSAKEPGFARRVLVAMATPRSMAVLSFFLAYLFSTILALEWLGRTEGIGHLLSQSLSRFDIPVLMACVFIVGSMLLVMFLILDIVMIIATAPHSTRHSLGDAVSPVQISIVSWGRLGFRSIGRLWTAFRKNRTGVAALTAFILLIVVSLLAPVLAPVDDPYFSVTSDILMEPSLSPSPITGITHLLGTDSLGRDVYSMLLYDSLDAVLFVVVLATVALLLGSSVALIIEYARRIDLAMARSISWVLWITAEVFLCMILLLSSLTDFLIGASFAIFAIMFAAWVYAPFARAESSRTLQPRGRTDGLEDHDRMGVTGAMSSSLHIAKHVVLFGFLTAVMAEMLLKTRSWPLGGSDVIDLGWAHTIVDAYNHGGLLGGWWWLFIPQTIMLCLLGGLSYVIIDRLEVVFERWHTPMGQPPPPTAEVSVALGSDGE